MTLFRAPMISSVCDVTLGLVSEGRGRHLEKLQQPQGVLSGLIHHVGIFNPSESQGTYPWYSGLSGI